MRLEKRIGQGISASWKAALVVTTAIALFGACETRKGEPDARDTCSTDQDCNGNLSCTQVEKVTPFGAVPDEKLHCVCVIGQRGATCSSNTDCIGAGSSVCDVPSCTCVNGGGGSIPTGDGGVSADGSAPGDDASNGGGVGRCTRECTTDSDCPTPTEDVCKNGRCYNGCKTKGCSHPSMTCVEVNGQARCVTACTTEDDCAGTGSCAIQADDGSKFCGNACTSDQDCADPNGAGHSGPHCVNGVCSCKADSECADDMFAPLCAN